MGKRTFFDELPPNVQQSMVYNAKAFQIELASGMPHEFSVQDLKQISSMPVLFVKGESSPRFYSRIIQIVLPCRQNAEQVTIPGATHDHGRATKPDVFNSKAIEFLQRHT